MNVFKRIKWTYVLLSVFFLVLGLLLVCTYVPQVIMFLPNLMG